MLDYNPILGILTAVFEIFAGIWILTKYKKSGINITSVLLFFLLAGYQILEVVICFYHNEGVLMLSRLAFIDVIWLPALTVLLVSQLNGHKSKVLKIYAIFTLVAAFIFSFWIFMDYRFISKTICEVMFAKYEYLEPYFHIYGIFYEVVQFSIIFIIIFLISREENTQTRKKMSNILTGVILYILPSFVLVVMFPKTTDLALPSIMCHFALLYAIFLFRTVTMREKIK